MKITINTKNWNYSRINYINNLLSIIKSNQKFREVATISFEIEKVKRTSCHKFKNGYDENKNVK